MTSASDGNLISPTIIQKKCSPVNKWFSTFLTNPVRFWTGNPKKHRNFPSIRLQEGTAEGNWCFALCGVPLKTPKTNDADLTFNFRKTALIFDHIVSIGLKTGLYGGRYNKCILALCKTSATCLHDESAYCPSSQYHPHAMLESEHFQDIQQSDLLLCRLDM